MITPIELAHILTGFFLGIIVGTVLNGKINHKSD